MRRSSLWLLLIALALGIVALLAVAASSGAAAPEMTPALAQSMLDRGKGALERRDAEALMALFSSNAEILGRSPAQMRSLLEQTMRELGANPLTVKFSNLELKKNADGAVVSVNLDVSQNLPKTDVSYFRPRVHLLLYKERIPRLLGIYSVEEWRIRRLDSDVSLDLPAL